MHQIIKLSNVKLQMRVGKKHSAGLNRLSLFVVQQAFDKDAWCFKLEVHGPGRNVHILGKMTGQKRLPETEFSERPWEVVRQTCTMARNDDGEVNESQDSYSDTQLFEQFDTVLDESQP